MSDQLPATSKPSAYELLSKPTKDLTDAEVLDIIVELRKRRAVALATGKPDKAPAEAKAKRVAAPKSTAAEKKAATLDILASLDLPGLE